MITIPDLGSKITVIGGHVGHEGVVHGTAINAKGELVRVSVRCDCGADLWLKSEDVDAVVSQEETT